MLKTDHRVQFRDARDLDMLETESIDLVVTSPPYPMIEMWDDLFKTLNPVIKDGWEHEDGQNLFELMHLELDRVWAGVYRVLRNDGVACVNVGDAVRSMGGKFSLFPNHARILMACLGLGFHALPLLLWRKPTNAPNKFMGSGMLPVGAYVTLEHEYILILRKGGLRGFESSDARSTRSESALFWEERNRWYSDLWDFRGVRQLISGVDQHDRSAAFPFELAYRLINMYSVRGDVVLDPFLGTGTTLFAALAACRNSIGFELDESFRNTIKARAKTAIDDINGYLSQRLENHVQFTEEQKSKSFKHRNIHYDFPVMTRQERELFIPFVERIDVSNTDADDIDFQADHIVATYNEEAVSAG
jgi:DNA modification methylase